VTLPATIQATRTTILTSRGRVSQAWTADLGSRRPAGSVSPRRQPELEQGWRGRGAGQPGAAEIEQAKAEWEGGAVEVRWPTPTSGGEAKQGFCQTSQAVTGSAGSFGRKRLTGDRAYHNDRTYAGPTAGSPVRPRPEKVRLGNPAGRPLSKEARPLGEPAGKSPPAPRAAGVQAHRRPVRRPDSGSAAPQVGMLSRPARRNADPCPRRPGDVLRASADAAGVRRSVSAATGPAWSSPKRRPRFPRPRGGAFQARSIQATRRNS